MASEPQLRAVPEADAPGASAEPRGDERGGSSKLPLLLGVALALALVLLAWSRAQLSGRIEALEAEVGTLQSAVAERDRVIRAQGSRLEEVRGRVTELGELLERPLPQVER